MRYLELGSFTDMNRVRMEFITSLIVPALSRLTSPWKHSNRTALAPFLELLLLRVCRMNYFANTRMVLKMSSIDGAILYR